MCSITSRSSKTKRCPLWITYGIMNAANVNSYIIYRESLQKKKEQVMKRTKYLIQLGKALITPWALTRLRLPIPRPLQILITTVCDILSLGSAAHSSGHHSQTTMVLWCAVLSAPARVIGRLA